MRNVIVCLTVTAFLIGHQIGILYKTPSFCQPKDFWKKLELHEKTAGRTENNPFQFESTFVHSNTGEKDAVLQTVFSMIHHASCPVDTELILTSRSDWGESPHFSTCDYMYATRSPVRLDQDNRCMAVARIDNRYEQYTSYTDVGHRTGIMTWPQKLKDQYQVSRHIKIVIFFKLVLSFYNLSFVLLIFC